MKIRNGFVSNSSSSSFVCDVCHRDEAGYDLGLSEAGMYECVNGHIFCEGHVTEEFDFDSLPLDEKRKLCIEAVWRDEHKEKIMNADEEALFDWYRDYVEDEMRYNYPAIVCPCCSLSSPTDHQILEYTLHEAGMSKEEAVKQMRDKFGSYEKMTEALKK